MKNFWEEHGIFFLFFITFFPRLTMLFATKARFGVLGWLGWIFFPYLTAAVLATKYYWNTNPILCTIAWFMAFAGTGSEIHFGKQAVEPVHDDQQPHIEHVMNFIHDPLIKNQANS